jgi:predicted regulator of Ras-like GTPase activity (Roadblock/LC7/MglB family)
MSTLPARPGAQPDGSAALLSRLTAQIIRGNPQVLAALLVDGQGRVRASEDKDPALLATAVAMVAPLRAFLDRASTELGCGMFRHALIEGDAATMALADVDGEHSAVLVGAVGSSPGALRADVLWLAAQIRAGFAT